MRLEISPRLTTVEKKELETSQLEDTLQKHNDQQIQQYLRYKRNWATMVRDSDFIGQVVDLKV
jgi:hypothetical protein